MKLTKLFALVESWAEARGIHEGDGSAQVLKYFEENGELSKAILRNDIDEIKDGIGDSAITLIIYCQQMGVTLSKEWGGVIFNAGNDCYDKKHAYLMIVAGAATATSLFLDGTKVVSGFHLFNERKAKKLAAMNCALEALGGVAKMFDLELNDCIESAYSIISKRTGKKINGSFVKSADLKELVDIPKSQTIIGK